MTERSGSITRKQRVLVEWGGTNHEHFTNGKITVMVKRHREIPDEIAKKDSASGGPQIIGHISSLGERHDIHPRI